MVMFWMKEKTMIRRITVSFYLVFEASLADSYLLDNEIEDLKKRFETLLKQSSFETAHINISDDWISNEDLH